MKKIAFTLPALWMLLLSLTASAATVTFPSSGTVTNAGGFKSVEVDGYRFAMPSYGSMLFSNGGLWSGSAFGVGTPITISRIDGGLFSMQGFTITSHVAFACGGGGFCGVEGVQAEGTKGDGGSAFSQFYDSGYADDLNSFGLDPGLFFDLKTAMIYAPDSFVLNSINLTANPAAVPLPAAAWLFCAGLFGCLGLRKARA